MPHCFASSEAEADTTKKTRVSTWWALCVLVLLLALVGVFCLSPDLPVGLHTGRRNVCESRLALIEMAKKEHAHEAGLTNGAVPTLPDIAPFLPSINSLFCPEACATAQNFECSYQINPIGMPPKCKVCPTNHLYKW
jgi:hypothetical protein